MIKVQQREGECRSGDCFSACLASILELPLGDVPVFTGDYYTARQWAWPMAINDWLRTRGYTVAHYPDNGAIGPECFHIVQGQSRRRGSTENDQHAVVAYGDRIVYDPNPDGVGIRSIEHRWVLVPTDWRYIKTPLLAPFKKGPMLDVAWGYGFYVLVLLMLGITWGLLGNGP